MHLACPGLVPALDSGATLVTPTHLLSQLASHSFAEHCLLAGLESWPRPEIYPVAGWLTEYWQKARYSGANVPALLSHVQEHALWRRIIQQETPGLFDIESTARLASRAASLVAEYEISLHSNAWDDHEDGQQFRSWLSIFRAACNEQGWIGRADLWRVVPKWIVSGECDTRPISFAGFWNDTPALRCLREAFGDKGHVLGFRQSAPAMPVPVRRCGDLSEEIEVAARWARAAFEIGSSRSIGVFVPQLSANRNLVERIFSQVFYPASAVFGAARAASESGFHLHAAPPLRDYPLISGALILLGLAGTHLPIGTASAILRSPWVTGAASERDQRALLDFDLRRSRDLDVSLGDIDLQIEASTRKKRLCPQLEKVLGHVRKVVDDKPLAADFATWSEFFSDLLRATGWPGDEDLSSIEQDLVEKWKDALSKLASLTLMSSRVSCDTALARLTDLLDDSGPETGDYFSPIQILDASDAYGVRFDEAFVVGVSEENNFFNGLTSPLIPLKLQRASNVPGSSATALLRAREQAVTDLVGAAPRMRATFSNRVLPLAQRFLAADSGDAHLWKGRTPQESYLPAELERLEDTNAPPYIPGDRSLGGTGLIKDQSQCPFRAFAVRRLNARSPEDGSFGLDSLDKGSFVHSVLKLVWDELKTREGLRNYPQIQLRFLIQDAVNRSLPATASSDLHRELYLAEAERLTDTVLDWLELECNRKMPFQVDVTEHKSVLNLGGLHLDIRIDRIDRVLGGKKLLIDYKSGEVSLSSMDTDRPKEPQLLAYAASMPRHEVGGFFLGQLKARKPRLLGYSAQRHADNKRSQVNHWDDFLDNRIGVVERLAKSFIAGDAAVNPLKGACEYCGIGPLCRVNELRCTDNGEEIDS